MPAAAAAVSEAVLQGSLPGSHSARMDPSLDSMARLAMRRVA